MSGPTKMEKMFSYAAKMLNSVTKYEDLMRQILALTLEAADADAAMVCRIDPEVEMIRGRFRDRENPRTRYFKFPKGAGLLGTAAKHKKHIIVNDVASDDRFYKDFEGLSGIPFRSVLIVPLIGRGQLIGLVEAINKRDGDFDEHDLDILVALSNQCAVAIDNANLFRETKRFARERRLLYEVGKKLSSPLNIDDLLKMILDSLRNVVRFNAGGIYLLDEETRNLRTVYAEGYCKDDDIDIALKFGKGLVGWVVKTGEPLIVPDVSSHEKYIDCNIETRSEIVAPLKIDGKVLGVMNLESNKLAAFDENSLELMMTLASQAAISVERAILHDKLLKNEQLQAQLTIARQIQSTFLPDEDPQIDGYDISGVNIPSGEVGGDYFDFIKIIDYHTGIAIADVSGKGIPASLIMAAFRASLIAEIRNNFTIRTICSKVNHLLVESVEEGHFVTAFYGVLDSLNDVFTFANCGHTFPILIRQNRDVVFLREGGLPLGIMEDSVYDERPVSLQSGDLIFFYTDGVTEAPDKTGREYGEERIIRILQANRNLPARKIHQKIYNDVKAFASPDHIYDDLTMIVLKKESAQDKGTSQSKD